MSLWTPGGEHPVDRGPSSPGPAAPAGGPAPTPGPGAAAGLGGEGLTADQAAEAEAMAAEMAEVRAQLSEVPAAQVIANHAMGCWELAAIHLSSQPPKFTEAQLAIDAFGALTDVVRGHLGADESTLNDALAQLRLAFVQMKAGTDPADSSSPAPRPD